MNSSLTTRFLITTGVLAIAATVSAADTLHDTKWQTIDDETGKPKAIIKIVDNNGKLEGRIEKTYGYDAGVPCKTCKGKYKGKPLTGAKIFWGLQPTGKGVYNNGKIFDPQKGKSYNLKGKLINGDKTLELRGYVGTPLLGRTQKWKRLQ